MINGRNALGNNRYFDAKIGLAGAGLMGGLVYLANVKYGLDEAVILALKQATYTFFAGGVVTKMCENIAVSGRDKLRRMASVVVPSAFTIGLTFLVHTLRGTPDALESTVPTMVVAPLGTFYWGGRKRRQLEEISEDVGVLD